MPAGIYVRPHLRRYAVLASDKDAESIAVITS